MEHCQLGVLLGYASALGHTLLERQRYRPEAWPDARPRCQQAGIPEDRRVATTPPLAPPLRPRARAAGGPATGGTGDRVEGDERRLRLGLDAQPQAAVLAVSGKAYGGVDWRQRRGNTRWAALPVAGWTRLSAGAGAPGTRWEAWGWRPLAEPLEPGWCRWRLGRRRRRAPPAGRAYVVCAPPQATWAEVGRGAGTRCGLEPLFAAAQGAVGLDHSEVRSWSGWDRPMPRAMGALALRAVLQAGTLAVAAVKKTLSPLEDRRRPGAFKVSRGLGAR